MHCYDKFSLMEAQRLTYCILTPTSTHNLDSSKLKSSANITECVPKWPNIAVGLYALSSCMQVTDSDRGDPNIESITKDLNIADKNVSTVNRMGILWCIWYSTSNPAMCLTTTNTIQRFLLWRELTVFGWFSLGSLWVHIPQFRERCQNESSQLGKAFYVYFASLYRNIFMYPHQW